MKTTLRAFRLRCVLLVLLLAAAVPGTAAPVLDGLWKGPITMPGGQLEVIFRLVSLTGGSYFATLDVPLQKVSQLEVKVDLKGDTVIFASEEAGSSFTGRLAPDGKQIEGIWRQPGFQSPLTLSFAAAPINTAPKARLTPPYREEEVTYSNIPADLRLAGMLTIPAGPGPFPAVVLVSDAGAQDREGTVGDYRPLGTLGDYLTRRGVAVLRFDDRGVGRSTGDFSTTTTASLVSDVQAGLNYLRTRPEINVSQIGVIGHGEGGNVALLSAAQPLPPAFVVTLAAYGVPGSELVVQQEQARLRSLGIEDAQIELSTKRQQNLVEIIRNTPDAAQSKAIVANLLRQGNTMGIDEATLQARAVEFTSPRYRYFLDYNPLERLADVKCPVLLLNGTADLAVAPEANLSALAKGLRTNRDVTIRKLPGVNHLFQPLPTEWPLVNGKPHGNFSPAAEEIIRSWIVAHTTPKK
ncbi:alpha/beta hydrolase [Microvirga sp. STR05]|uniref:Alpha/beta hydrolase n=1 Tax=Hymenobacter duratus TaxID=2771356 RepID=A0ABR8JEN4_9BACT|nr:alpha/beta hydrolase [Hymenobacter duratus]MBD2713845.1 alpha/beta hydrolase [Hymenobacter duratus]MBR7948747.1 alpha/beta hydrolase [Microvirga sp. STR05]